MPTKILTVKTSGFSLDYIKFGTGKRDLVILPGLSVTNVLAQRDTIASDYKSLCEYFTVYLLERRSELPSHYTVHMMAEDTVLALDALGLSHVCLFGASLGGMIGFDIAAHHPGLIKKLFVASSPLKVTDTIFAPINSWIELAEKGDIVSLLDSMSKMIYPSDIYDSFKPMIPDAAAAVTPLDISRFITVAGGIKGFDVTNAFNSIKARVFVLLAKDDELLGDEAKGQYFEKTLDDGCPEFDICIKGKGFGHAVYDTADDFKFRLLEFFK